jgi:Flp pilus assembly protein TadG
MRRNFLRDLKSSAPKREAGQIIVLFALFIVIFTVLAGSAYDYGSIVVDDAKLQNAVDSAVLAGSDALSSNATLPYGTPAAMAKSAAISYLSLNGVGTATPGTDVNITFPTSTPVSGVPTPATPVVENIDIQVSRAHATSFWPLVGVNSVTNRDGGRAQAARGLIDVMVVMDTTGSMVASGSIPAEQNAVVEFVSAMNPNTSDPRSPRVAMARFQGTSCSLNSFNVVISCTDDYTLLTGLTGDAASLIFTANASGAGSCYNPTHACPLNFHSPGTGTKLPNAMNVVGSGASYVFTGTNSRNNIPTGSGWAKKVLIVMTDGENDDTTGADPNQAPGWDTQLASRSAALKLGPDGVAGNQDDVEIYTVNFQCDAANVYYSGNCVSALASRAPGNHMCPGPSAAAVPLMSNSDQILYNASSSTSGTCDHYFPLRKDEDLPTLFRQLAGTISRGALTQ